jgi:hypothetical protein
MSNSQSAQSSSVSLSCVVMNRKEIDVSLQVHFHRAIFKSSCASVEFVSKGRRVIGQRIWIPPQKSPSGATDFNPIFSKLLNSKI